MGKNWNENNDKLEKEFKFTSFSEALEFVNKCGAIFEKLDHHGDILMFDYKFVKISTTTHEQGNKLTQKDYDLVKEIDLL